MGDDERGTYGLLTGVAGGLLATVVTGIVIQFGLDPAILSDGIAGGFGRSGLVAGWAILLATGLLIGLAYAAVATTDRLHTYAAVPGTGAALGFVSGLLLWVLAVVFVPLWVGGVSDIGTYAVTARGVLSFALLGTVLGLVYGISPYTD